MSDGTAADLVPSRGGLPALRDAASGCQACPLYRNATQTVFGEGTRNAELMFVGEQPGDREDLEGEPFVGPSGRLLDQGLDAAGIDRGAAYVTNLVKHFKWEPKGKRRIHKKPNADEIMACRPWLDAEIDKVDPKVVVCLGATPAKALIAKDFKVTVDRGQLLPWHDRLIVATVHPSSVLRARGNTDRRAERDRFFSDLKAIAKAL